MRSSDMPRYTRSRMSFQPGAGISEGVLAERPRPLSCASLPSGCTFPCDDRGPNPPAINKALNPITHRGVRTAVDAAVGPDRPTSLLVMKSRLYLQFTGACTRL